MTATIKGVGLGPSDVATGLGYVWVVNSKDDTLVRIDPAQEHAGRQGNPRGHRLTDVTVGYGAIWVAAAQDNEIVRVKP